MKQETQALQALAKRVIARQQFLEAVIHVAEALLCKHGEVLKQQIHSSHTYSEEQLENFEGFTFFMKGSYTMFGGERLQIWYHPGSKEHGDAMVLDLEWWDVKECKVHTFDPSPAWQRAIKRIAKDTEKAQKHFERTQAKEEAQKIREHKRQVALHNAALHYQQEKERLKL